jgi:dsDNA-binding SOS-regulon protein
MRLYRYEKINNEIKETYIMSFTSERDAFDKMIDMQYHLVKSGYAVIWKRFELE